MSSLNLHTPFCMSTFTPKILNIIFNAHTREKQYLFIVYTMYTYPSNNTPHISLYVVWRHVGGGGGGYMTI